MFVMCNVNKTEMCTIAYYTCTATHFTKNASSSITRVKRHSENLLWVKEHFCKPHKTWNSLHRVHQAFLWT